MCLRTPAIFCNYDRSAQMTITAGTAAKFYARARSTHPQRSANRMGMDPLGELAHRAVGPRRGGGEFSSGPKECPPCTEARCNISISPELNPGSDCTEPVNSKAPALVKKWRMGELLPFGGDFPPSICFARLREIAVVLQAVYKKEADTYVHRSGV